VTHSLYKIGFVLAAVLIFPINLTSVWAGAFFVDKGQTDVVEGVAFELVPPYLFIKKAFKLRGENLTPAQLRIIQEAMPAIAGMTHQILTRTNNRQTEAQEQEQVQVQVQVKPRNIYQIQNIEGPTQLYIQTLKNWQVTETSIQFSSDYFYTPSRGPKVNFRDTYVFTKSHNVWQFSKHPRSAPDGVLKCTKTAEGWMRCD
jgi:Zn-dependent protease with chaperone function